MARARDYAAEYAARVARGRRLGLSTPQARGHARAKAGERSISRIRELAGRQGLSPEAVTRWGRETRRGPRGGSHIFAVAAGAGFDTNSDRDAAQFVRGAAREGLVLSRVIGTRANKRGVVLYELTAAELLEEIEFRGGSVAHAIESLAPARYYGELSPIVRYHFFAVAA